MTNDEMDETSKAKAFDIIRALIDVPEDELVDSVKSYLDYIDTLESQIEAAEYVSMQTASDNDRLQKMVRQLRDGVD